MEPAVPSGETNSGATLKAETTAQGRSVFDIVFEPTRTIRGMPISDSELKTGTRFCSPPLPGRPERTGSAFPFGPKVKHPAMWGSAWRRLGRPPASRSRSARNAFDIYLDITSTTSRSIQAGSVPFTRRLSGRTRRGSGFRPSPSGARAFRAKLFVRLRQRSCTTRRPARERAGECRLCGRESCRR